MKFLVIDGGQGEGGGQILRTSLTLSMITGQPFRIERIRAGRSRPGLLRQHLTAVQAAAAICGARVRGDTLGSLSLSFEPGPVRAGNYRFAIGTAGSCTLVLQTVLPALWFADGPSTVTVSGGTHNTAAPPADFLIQTWLPLMRRMGVEMEIHLARYGFQPAGGGEMQAVVRPVAGLKGLFLLERGPLQGIRASAVLSGIAREVAERELETLASGLAAAGLVVTEQQLEITQSGVGNALLLSLEYAQITEVLMALGQKSLPAEQVAHRLVRQARALHQVEGVGEYLSDQLLLPLALAGEGAFLTGKPSGHLLTNLEIIQHFLPARMICVAEEEGLCRVMISEA